VTRAVVAPDDPDRIAREVSDALASDASLVFVCGGLGPTHDDRTMEGVAAALGVELELCTPLAARIEEALSHAGAAGFSDDAFGAEGLRKMALAPAGARLLDCSIGVIPAVECDAPNATVIVLPGPPRELQLVFTEAVEPAHLEGTGEMLWREEITHPFPESTLAALLTDLQARYPSTAIGSYPQHDHTLIRVAGPTDEATAVADAVRHHLAAMHASDEAKRFLAFLDDRRRERRG
jgi:molybdopterin-biosynthesis enzyme MoeA-like protein